MTEIDTPSVVRRLNTPESTQLANLASVFEDLQFVLKCCEELVTRLARPDNPPDDVVCQALWTSALIAYMRCFSIGGKRGGLTEQDLAETGLKGEVGDWHTMLRRMRDHQTAGSVNPRERFTIGVAQDVDGRAAGVAIVSAPLPGVEDLAVRQTGQLALELSRLVDQRMSERQRVVFESARGMSARLLNSLPRVQLDGADPEPDAGPNTGTGPTADQG